MSCQDAHTDYVDSLATLRKLCDVLDGYAHQIGEQLGERPMLLVGGEVNSWRRYAKEAEIAAQRQSAALERWFADARGPRDHGSPAT